MVFELLINNLPIAEGRFCIDNYNPDRLLFRISIGGVLFMDEPEVITEKLRKIYDGKTIELKACLTGS